MTNWIRGSWLGGFFFLFPFQVFAFWVDMGAFYMSDSLKVSSTTQSTRLLGDISLGLNLDKKGYFVLGWSYNYISASDTGSSDTTFTSGDMGPKFGYYIDRDKYWGLFLTYNLIVNASYTSTSTSKWRGTSYKAEISYTPQFSDNIYGGISLNYFLSNYNEQFTGSSTFSTISNSRSIIYPSIKISYRM